MTNQDNTLIICKLIKTKILESSLKHEKNAPYHCKMR
jgi:hypothetical protein